MKLIKDRDRRTVYRKLKKEAYDSLLTLSVSDKTYTQRLLDEGTIVTAEGEPDFYIEKGAIQQYVDSFPDDIVGTINLGHLPFAQFPIILGTWSKEDLEVVDIGDGRKGLNVNFRLNTNLHIVQDLLMMPYDLGISSEVYLTWDKEASEKVSKELGAYVPVAKGIYIEDFAIVGEAGNVNSSGLDLKGDN